MLQFPAPVGFRASWPFAQAASECQYRRAHGDLRRLQRTASQGQAVFETRADNLQATLDRISADVGSASAAIDQEVGEGRRASLDSTPTTCST